MLAGQALREGLKTKAQIEAFVAKLRAGEAAFEDEAEQGRSKSLGASLSYGFQHAFDETERKALALLHFFQGFVDVDTLRVMGDPKMDWCLPEVRGLTREGGIALLDRAAEVGLLTVHGGGGGYSIHPALPWYFKSLFEEHYALTPISEATPSPTGKGESDSLSLWERVGVREKAIRAFIEAMGELGTYYHRQYNEGNRDVIAALSAEEANLLHARRLARANGWWDALTRTMQGLRSLYDHTGRRAAWKRLVGDIVPDFVDPATDGPLAGREEQWSLVTEYRVRLAMEARQWGEAERLQRPRVEWDRRRAASALALPPEALDGTQRNAIRTLAASLHTLGQIQRELGQAECVKSYEETAGLTHRIGDKAAEASAAFNLGHAYKNLPAIRDLTQAEQWYRRSLELHDEGDRLGRGKCFNQLGLVARERFKEAREAKQPEAELLKQHLNAALQAYQQALALLPPDAVNDLAVVHNQLGNIYRDAGDLDRALHHYREGIGYDEASDNFYGAGQTRGNVARALRDAGRLADAREYAHAALRNFEGYGEGAAADIERTRGLIGEIESLMH